MDRMDRCKCWTTTKLILTIEHCPSVEYSIKKIFDELTEYTAATDLKKLGKYNFLMIHNEE